MNSRTKLPARKSLFSSKPITAYALDEYPPPTDPQTYPTSPEVAAFTLWLFLILHALALI